MKHSCNSLLLCGIALLWAPVISAQEVAIQRVTDHVITLSMSNIGMHTNVTVIETRKGLVVVETEMTPGIMKTIKEAAEKELGRKDWAYVINTHQHLHHAGGNCAFPDAQIIGHERMSMDRLKSTLSSDRGRRGYCGMIGVDTALRQLHRNLAEPTLTPAQKEVLRRRRRFCEALKREIMTGFEVRNPTITIDEYYELDMGDIHLRLTDWGAGINHSSIFVHVVEDNLLVGMSMAGKWIPHFVDHEPSLEGIRRVISMWEKLCDEDFPIDVMIGVHKPYLIRSRQRFQQESTYFQTLLDDLTQAQQDGLSLEQAKAEFSLNKRHALFCRLFPLPEPEERREKKHQESIDTIWELLQQEALSARVDGISNRQVRPKSQTAP
jgi:glyoxylase-like metal-dependent hydrolase (beta-lactamase superfamily II)